MIPRALLIPLVIAAGGCAQQPGPARVPAAAVTAVIERAAQQVRRCYRSPRVASSGKQIITRLRVRYRPNGELAALPALVSQDGVTPANRYYAGKMAEAAGLAVVRCAPLTLPAELYEQGWSTLDLIFSPAARA